MPERAVRPWSSRPAEGGSTPGWVGPVFGLAALALVPWTALLVAWLPSAHRATHWNIAWGGFDIALALLLLTVAATAWRRSPWLEGAATATATLLFVDAWFDILTASTRTDLVLAIAEAAFVELPLAVLCLLLARRAEPRVRLQSKSSRDFPLPRLRLVTRPTAGGVVDDSRQSGV